MRKKTKRSLHVVPYQGQWALMEEGSERLLNLFETQESASRSGTLVAMLSNTEILIHNADGTISYRESYRKYRRHRRCRAVRKTEKMWLEEFFREEGYYKYYDDSVEDIEPFVISSEADEIALREKGLVPLEENFKR